MKNLLKIKEILFVSKESVIGIAIIGILICFLLSPNVSDYIFKHARYQEITIRKYDDLGSTFPKLIDNNYMKDNSTNVVFEKKYGFLNYEGLKSSIVDSEGIKFVEAEESEWGYGYFEFLDDNSYLLLKLPVYPNTSLTFLVDSDNSTLSIENDKGPISYAGIWGMPEDVKSKNIYLFKASEYGYILLYYILLYIIIFTGVYTAVSFVFYIYRNYLKNLTLINGWSQWMTFGAIILFHVAYCSINYYHYRDMFQVGESADAYYYMYPRIFDEEGNFSLNSVINWLYVFRGYFFIVVAVVFNNIALLINIDVMYLYFTFYAIVISYTIVFSLPKLYKSFFQKQAKNMMCIFMYLSIFTFWRGLFFYNLSDIVSAMFALSALSSLVCAIRKGTKKEYFFSGLFIGLATSYRASYTYVFWLMLFVLFVNFILGYKQKKYRPIQMISIILMFFLGLVVITWPQGYLNFMRGHIGLFPYSAGWAYDINQDVMINDTMYSFTNGLHNYGFLYPLKDMQLPQIDQKLYMDKYYNIGDIIYMILTNPVEFVCGYIKKMFWAMSAGIESVYWWKKSSAFLAKVTVILNYWLIGNLVYMSFKKKNNSPFQGGLGWFYVGISMVTIILQNLLHIERRYYLIYYLLIYFFNSFVLLNHLKEKEDAISIRYEISTLIFIAICYSARETIIYNFI